MKTYCTNCFRLLAAFSLAFVPPYSSQARDSNALLEHCSAGNCCAFRIEWGGPAHRVITTGV